MNDATEIRQKLKSSLDLAVIRRDIVLVFLVVALCQLRLAFGAGGFHDPSYHVMVAVIVVLCILPVLGYSLCVILRIFRQPAAYIFCRCKLSQPHSSRFRGVMYFTVVLEDPADGGKFIVNTRPIFASYGLAGPLLEDYINKTVTVAYNEETEMVVVIG